MIRWFKQLSPIVRNVNEVSRLTEERSGNGYLEFVMHKPKRAGYGSEQLIRNQWGMAEKGKFSTEL